MGVQILCPNLSCRKVLSVPSDIRGKTVKCSHCSTLFKVPGQGKMNVANALNSHLAPSSRRAS